MIAAEVAFLLPPPEIQWKKTQSPYDLHPDCGFLRLVSQSMVCEPEIRDQKPRAWYKR